jgi:myo-inositol-1(or 4)-monophosphatase
MNGTSHLDTALGLAKKAGAIIRTNFDIGMKKEWKSDHTPVTQTDLHINDLILKEIKHAYPDHSILAEEGDDFSAEHDYVWICDPVDGTHNFSHGIPTATFALALTHKGAPLVSVIYDPFLDRMFSAEKGTGARMNGKPIAVSEGATTKRSLIGMGKMKGVRNLFPVMAALYDYGPRLMTGLSIHYMSALVACGEFSAAFFGGTSAHDMTAGKLLVEEAGGKATDLFGSIPERFDRDMQGQVCSNGILHQELLDLLDRVSPKEA